MLCELAATMPCPTAQIVHTLYARGGAAVEPVGSLFPEAVVNGAVDRPTLSRFVVGAANDENMKKLERVVHPLVAEKRSAFLQEARWLLTSLDPPPLTEKFLSLPMAHRRAHSLGGITGM